MKTPTLEEQMNSIEEAGDMHNEDCCVHFPEDSRACDVDMGEMDCCENMRFIKRELLTAMKIERKRLEGLIRPRAQKFINKVDTGKARSKETYKDMQYIVDLFED